MKKIYKNAMIVSSSMLGGMALGLMVAPSSGKETRKNIANKFMKSNKSSDNDNDKDNSTN